MRRLSIFLISLIVALAATVAAMSPVSAATKRSVTFTVSASSVLVGGKVTLSGKVTKSPKGAKVRVERLVGSAWKAVRTVKTSAAKGAFTVTIRMSDPGRTSYRAVAPKTKKLKAATSRPRAVTVRALTSPAPTPSPAPATPVPSPAPSPTRSPEPTSPEPTSPEPPDPSTRPFTSFEVTPPEIAVGGRVWISGAIASSPDGSVVDIQTSTGGAWKTIMTTRISARGGFSLTIELEEGPGTVRIRAVSPASGELAAAASVVRTVVVRDDIPAEPTSGVSSHLLRLSGSLDEETWWADRGFGSVSFSADQRYVSYIEREFATSIAMLRLLDRQTGITTDVVEISREEHRGGDTSMSADGRWIAISTRAPLGIPRADEDSPSLYLWSRETGQLQLVDEVGYWASITDNGRFVTYTGITGVRRWDRETGLTASVPGSFQIMETPSSSEDGRYVIFTSAASDVVPEPTYEHCVAEEDGSHEYCDSFVVYLWDTQTDAISVVSKAYGGGAANGEASGGSISRNGRWITYASSATNLVAGRTQRKALYRFDRVAGTTTVVAELAPYQANRWYEASSISDDGRYVAYNRAPDPWEGGMGDVLTWDAVTNTSIHIGEGAVEHSPQQRISADGRFIVFMPQPSSGSRWVDNDYYLWDRSGA